MNERQSSRSSRGSKGGNERKLIVFAVIAVVLLFIGGLIGGASLKVEFADIIGAANEG